MAGRQVSRLADLVERLSGGVAALARVALWCGGAMLFAAALIVSAEVLLRKGVGAVLGTGFVFSGSDEISGYLFAVGVSWSMAHVLISRGHVRIDALYGRLGPRARAVCDLLALLMLGIFIAALVERAWDVAWTSYAEYIRSNTNLRVWLAWPQLAWFGGIALFFVALVLAVVRTALALARGDYAAATRIAGVPSQDEEVAAELEGLGVGMPRGGKT